MKRLVLTAALFFLTAIPCAAGMISVATPNANIVTIPSLEDPTVIQKVPRFYPLHITGETRNDFLQVEDFRGQAGWIHQSAVSDTATVVVTGNTVNIRRGPGSNHPVIFKANKGVAFAILRQQGQWLEVLHETGRRGWIYKDLTWGAPDPAK